MDTVKRHRHTPEQAVRKFSEGEQPDGTEDHPFWNATDGEWQHADALDPGDALLTATGVVVPVDGIDWTTTQVGTAYNLTVDDLHTYHVTAGDATVLVHNTGAPDCDSYARSLLKRIDGEPWVVVNPLGPNYPLPPYALAPDARWFHHTVVIDEAGLVHDFFIDTATDGAGIGWDEFKALWGDYADDIAFTPQP